LVDGGKMQDDIHKLALLQRQDEQRFGRSIRGSRPLLEKEGAGNKRHFGSLTPEGGHGVGLAEPSGRGPFLGMSSPSFASAQIFGR
jgi:hypothetical protein